jgi:hemerythrin-like metal-binding protein
MTDNFNNSSSSWSDFYSLGIKEIDEQHKGFLDMLDNAAKNLASADLNQHKEIIQKLQDYFINHFTFEEDLMKYSGYEKLEEHIGQHKMFISRVNQLKTELDYENPVLSQKIMDFMRKWFVSHIIQTDKQYKEIVVNYLSK